MSQIISSPMAIPWLRSSATLLPQLGETEQPSVGFLVIILVSVMWMMRALQRWIEEIRYSRQHGCLPPRQHAKIRDPIFGIDFLAESIRAARQKRYFPLVFSRFQRYGPTFVARRLLFQTVHTIEPRNVQAVLSSNFESFNLPTLRIDAMTPLFGSGIFTSEGTKWRHSRALLRPSLTRDKMDPMIQMMERHVHLLLQRIPSSKEFTSPSLPMSSPSGSDEKPGWTPTFNLQELVYCFTMDTGTEFLMGKSTNTLTASVRSDGKLSAEQQFVQDFTDSCVHAVRQIQLGPIGSFYRSRHSIECRDRAWRYVERLVDDAMAANSKEIGGDKVNNFFLNQLVAATDDRAAVRDEILNLLLASRDTTASLVSSLFFELARRPDIYEELRQEVRERLPPRTEVPTDKQLHDLPLLRRCINETLRLYPPVPANTRQAVQNTTLPSGGGPDGQSPLFVRAGTLVMYSAWSMHRREDIFGDEPDRFHPERWEGRRPGWAFAPFNGGYRICLGQHFALTVASFLAVRLLQNWERLESMDDRPWTEFYTLAVCNGNGVQVRVKPVDDGYTS